MRLKVFVNPNPFTSQLQIRLHGEFTANLILRLKNSRGTVVRMVACTLPGGSDSIDMNDLQRFAAGRYDLQISLLSGEQVTTVSIVKTK